MNCQLSADDCYTIQELTDLATVKSHSLSLSLGGHPYLRSPAGALLRHLCTLWDCSVNTLPSQFRENGIKVTGFNSHGRKRTLLGSSTRKAKVSIKNIFKGLKGSGYLEGLITIFQHLPRQLALALAHSNMQPFPSCA